jgi:predicted O-methyltransferase YrrM
MVRSRLRWVIQGVSWRTRGLWGALAVSAGLAVYGLSGLPGHELVALVAFIPLIVVWRRRLLRTWRGRVADRTSQLAAVLSVVKDGIVLTDVDGRIVLADAAFEDLCGRSTHDLTGRPLSGVLKDGRLGSMIARAKASETASFSRINASQAAFDASALPVFRGGSVIGLLIVLRGMHPNSYDYRESPQPRPRSTLSLREVLAWLLPPFADRLGTGEINAVVHKCLHDPDYAGKYGVTGSAERETGQALYALIRLLEPKNVIEIGSYVGASSICIAQALADNAVPGLLHCVELEERHVALTKDHLAEAALAERARLYCGSSQDPAIVHSLPRSELIFIDGDHTHEGAKKDFEIYEALLSDDGVIVFHDTVKIMSLQRLMMEISQDPRFDTISLATSDGDGMTLVRRRSP